MFGKISLSLLLGVTALAATTVESSARARPFAIYDANSGDRLYDDGKLDGRACAVGQRAIYNPNTGQFVVIPAAKCNF